MPWPHRRTTTSANRVAYRRTPLCTCDFPDCSFRQPPFAFDRAGDPAGPFDCKVCRTCNYGVMTDQMGLRERRRRQTSADIRDAAVRLALERGFDKVTIEEICSEAGI